MKHKDLSQREFIRPFEIQARYGISRSTVYRLMKLGKFPPSISLTERCTGWRRSTLDKHFAIEQVQNKVNG